MTCSDELPNGQTKWETFLDVHVDALLSTLRRASPCRQTRKYSRRLDPSHLRNGFGRDVVSHPFFQGHSQSPTRLVSIS